MADADNPKMKAIERARKLMAMAADSSSPHEAAIAARRARAIMDKYQLDFADLKDQSNFSAAATGAPRARVPIWEQFICVGIAELNDCVVHFNKHGCFIFKGFDEDVQVARFMYGYLAEHGIRCCKNFMAKNPDGCRNSYKLGYANAVRDKIDGMLAERKEQLKTSDGKSLVLLKKQLVENEFGKAGYKTKKRSTPADLYSTFEGYQAGKRTNIVNGIDAETRDALQRSEPKECQNG